MLTTQDDAGDREPQLRRRMKSICSHFGRLLALRAHEARVVEPAEAREQAEHRARRGDRGEQRDHGADQQHQREALHAARSRPRTGRAP